MLTSRLNQDCIENLFSQVRALGGNKTHPTSVDFINRIRSISLCKNVNSIVENSSVELASEDEFISVEQLSDVPCSFEPDVPDSDMIIDDEVVTSHDESDERINYVAGYICKQWNLDP